MPVPDELQFMVNARRPQHTTAARLDGQICVITGATSGVGLAAAVELTRGGAHLVMLCRNREKADRVKQQLATTVGQQPDIVMVDMQSFDQVRRAAQQTLDLCPRIDLLINCAGVHQTRRELTPDGNEMAFAVNHLASFLLTRLLLQRMRDSAPARIIQVNSEGHRFGGLELDDLTWERRRYRGLQGYGASKIAQLLTVWELAEQLAGSGVTINAMHPGAVRSNIGMNNGWLYRQYSRVLQRFFLKDAAISGSALYYLAAAPEMASINGRFFHLTNEETPAPHALDRALGRRVWEISEALTGLSSPNTSREGESDL